jgi:hypothetical protein
MPDKKTVKDDRPAIEPHPEGQFAALCIDMIDLGLTVETFAGQDPQLKDKVALVFRTEEKRDGKPLHIHQEFTCSMGKKANLRKFLESWRGKPYSDDEVKKQGVPLDKLCGNGALVTIAHKTSGAGNVYAFISSIARLPKQMEGSMPPGDAYERPEFWEKRKLEYRAKAEAFQPKVAAGKASSSDFGDYPEALDEEDDDLPF